jgi:hypothetical protein
MLPRARRCIAMVQLARLDFAMPLMRIAIIGLAIVIVGLPKLAISKTASPAAERISGDSGGRIGTFHAAWNLSWTGAQTNAPGTKFLWSHYPDGVRRWIARHGGLQSQTIYLGGRELTAMYPTCR